MKNLIDKITKRATDSAAIEGELKRLGDRKADAERRRSEVLAAVEDAREARRNLLDGDQAAIDQASVKLKALQAEAADLAELLDDLEVAIEAAAERFRNARDQEARSEAAQRLEAAAGKVEGQTKELEASARLLAKAAKAMIAAIPEEIGIAPGHHSDRPGSRRLYGMLSGWEMVAACVADALAYELPELFDAGDDYRRSLHAIVDPNAPMPSYTSRELRRPIPAREIVSALIVDRLRDRAAKIRAGELEPVLDDIRPPAPEPKRMKTVGLLAIQNVSLLYPHDYRMPIAGSFRKLILEGQSESFREDHADILLKSGRFLKRSSPEGEKFLADLQAKRSSLRRSIIRHAPPESVDLGDPLGLVGAEREEAAQFD